MLRWMAREIERPQLKGSSERAGTWASRQEQGADRDCLTSLATMSCTQRNVMVTPPLARAVRQVLGDRVLRTVLEPRLQLTLDTPLTGN